MEKNKKIKVKRSSHLGPNEKVLLKIRKQLSSRRVQGSQVIRSQAPLVEQFKQSLCSKIVEYYLKNHMTQKEMGMKLGIDEPEVSRILHYKMERYSLDRLMSYLEILYPHMTVEVKAA